ncbi:MAG: hypothetical protein L6U99_02310 [Clostridium sp.]|nr:MAG: hypothetical protein L6U99_02310 [Clostridium sp.]
MSLEKQGSRITGKLNELISGALIIQDFNQEDAMMDDYKSLVNKYNDNDKKRLIRFQHILVLNYCHY